MPDADQGNKSSARIELRAPEALRGAVNRAARGRMMSAGAYVRGAIIEKLRADGIDPTQPETIAPCLMAGSAPKSW